LCILVASLGGGTGSGAGPVFAKIAKKKFRLKDCRPIRKPTPVLSAKQQKLMGIRFSTLVFTFLFFSDQITKILVNLLSDTPHFINPICNSSIAWGVPIKPALFYPLWLAVLLFLARLLTKEADNRNKIALIFILAGGLSNMLDRALYGCVVDFIDLKIWPVFNLADIYITIGVIALLTIKILNPKR